MTHGCWCELQYTIKIRYNKKRAGTQIKKNASSKAAYLSDSNKYARIPVKNKARTGVYFKHQWKNSPKHHSAQLYRVLYKKAGMPE